MTEIAKLAARAVEAVDDGELVKLLQRMIRIRSYSAGGEEAQIARFVQDCCATLGLESTLQEVQPAVSTSSAAGAAPAAARASCSTGTSTRIRPARAGRAIRSAATWTTRSSMGSACRT